MSYMKNYFFNQIQSLADETGYDVDFLLDTWREVQEDGDCDWNYFCGVTRELDW